MASLNVACAVLARRMPGAWFAQLAFRRKTKKTSFVATFAVCVIVNVAALGWIVADPNNPLMHLLS